jgi:hypothetical protein
MTSLSALIYASTADMRDTRNSRGSLQRTAAVAKFSSLQLHPGRRLKFAPGARVKVKSVAPAEYRGRSGTIIDYLGSSQYVIKFDAGQTEYLLSQWLEATT